MESYQKLNDKILAASQHVKRIFSKNMNKLRFSVAAILCLFSFLQLFTQTRETNFFEGKREMRGIWVSTINNIDWPSEPGLPAEQLKSEACKILDRVKQMGLNTIFLQVRPSSDVIYQSAIEPWTVYLTGKDKLNVGGGFDPLLFWVTEAHKRGLELHAWINPFRVTPKANYDCAPWHLSNTHPEWLITYAGKKFLDPGIPQARKYLLSVTSDILNHYDIDGIHFDDYFYPYPVKNEVFADSLSFAKYNPEHLTLHDWRRSNVDAVIESVGKQIHQTKPWVAFGVSPFGVWRNKADDKTGSDTRAGVTNYDVLYADVLKWIDKKWIDYIVPQIYWESGHPAANFDVLTDWWAKRPHNDVHIFVGHAAFKINTGQKSWANALEMPTQIEKVRASAGLDGSVFFSYRQFNRDLLGLDKAMAERLYRNRALSPLILNTHSDDIEVKKIKRRSNTIYWQVDEEHQHEVRFYAIYRYQKGDNFDADRSNFLLDIIDKPQFSLRKNNGEETSKFVYRIAVIDLYRHEHSLSPKITVRE